MAKSAPGRLRLRMVKLMSSGPRLVGAVQDTLTRGTGVAAAHGARRVRSAARSQTRIPRARPCPRAPVPARARARARPCPRAPVPAPARLVALARELLCAPAQPVCLGLGPQEPRRLALALFDPAHAPAARAAWGPVAHAAPALAHHTRRSQHALAEAEAAVHAIAGGIGAGVDAELERALGLAAGQYHRRCERAGATLARWSAVTRELRSSSVLLATHMRSVEAHLAAERTRLRRCAHAATAGGGELAAESLHWREPLRGRAGRAAPRGGRGGGRRRALGRR